MWTTPYTNTTRPIHAKDTNVIMMSKTMLMRLQAARRPLPAVAGCSSRRFAQQSSAPAPSNQTPAVENGAAGEEAPKYKPGFFSRNPGIVLGGVFLSIGLYVYRSSRGKKNFEAAQLPIADAAVISPYEAWELRSSNEISPETFKAVREGIFNAFSSGKAAISQFDRYLGYKLAEACPQGLNKAYHLERVLLSLEKDEEQRADVDALMVAFSMAVKGAVDERLQCLFDLAARDSAAAAEDEKTITQPELERLIDLLLKTYQIPSEKRVLAVKEEKFPFQQYQTATPYDLLQAAVQAQVDAKVITSEEANTRNAYTFEAFQQIMTGKTVCLWGECFGNGKKRMKN